MWRLPGYQALPPAKLSGRSPFAVSLVHFNKHVLMNSELLCDKIWEIESQIRQVLSQELSGQQRKQIRK